jgi:hypothetical protein
MSFTSLLQLHHGAFADLQLYDELVTSFVCSSSRIQVQKMYHMFLLVLKEYICIDILTQILI